MGGWLDQIHVLPAIALSMMVVLLPTSWPLSCGLKITNVQILVLGRT